METDEQLNDMTLVIVHSVLYYIVRYNMLLQWGKSRKKVQFKEAAIMFVSKAKINVFEKIIFG